jgi:hypothetical protein
MEVVEQTNDPVTLSAYQAVLRQAGIESWVLDHHTSILEGSLGVLPRRLMVESGDGPRARRILDDYRRDLEDGRLEEIDPFAQEDQKQGEWGNG